MPASSRMILLALATVLGAATAGTEGRAGGLRAELSFRDSTRAGEPVERATVWVSNRRIRIEQHMPGSKRAPLALIYRGDQDRIYSIDRTDKAYVGVDRAVIVSLGRQIHAARREMGARLARLPADQRAMAERLIGARETAEVAARHPLIARALDETDTVSGHACEVLELTRKEAVVGQACIVAWKTVGIDRDDLEIFRDLANLQRELMGARQLTPLEVVPNQPLDILVQLDGFPLRYERQKRGVETSSIVVTSFEVGDLDNALFQIPEGYAARGTLPFLAGTPGPEIATPTAPPASP